MDGRNKGSRGPKGSFEVVQDLQTREFERSMPQVLKPQVGVEINKWGAPCEAALQQAKIAMGGCDLTDPVRELGGEMRDMWACEKLHAAGGGLHGIIAISQSIQNRITAYSAAGKVLTAEDLAAIETAMGDLQVSYGPRGILPL